MCTVTNGNTEFLRVSYPTGNIPGVHFFFSIDLTSGATLKIKYLVNVRGDMFYLSCAC